MGTVAWISAASFGGSALSLVLASLIAFSARASWIPALISFAIGALLGAVFLDILPNAFAKAEHLPSVEATILGGILAFFVLEKLVLWRHCHVEDCEAHDKHGTGGDHGRSGLMDPIGGRFHNSGDGILVAAACLEGTQLGIVTAAAIIAHEIPQEIGDFVVLLHSGYGKAAALTMNALSGLAMLVGALVGYLALHAVQAWIHTALALAAAS